ncbi:hypothetical protein RHSIM_Rhsim04G0047700 [Rhododendron simsii]|uniref:Uncharacterized protein n=1 Tax=Rhododendron simsii TaxID=118357 RepID=A0A834LRT2_RHOSS|nr:hypothetical protein RHSIM_Rhsim04G0047700 [Rhododendron simsii]
MVMKRTWRYIDGDRGRDRESRRDSKDDRSKRSHTPNRTQSRSPYCSSRRHHHRTPRRIAAEAPQAGEDDDVKDPKMAAAVVSQFIDGIVREYKQQQRHKDGSGAEEDAAMDADESRVVVSIALCLLKPKARRQLSYELGSRHTYIYIYMLK